MDAVVPGVLTAAVGYAAAGDNDHVAVLADEKVVVDRLLKAAFAEYHGDMDALVDGAVLDVYVDTGDVGL